MSDELTGAVLLAINPTTKTSNNQIYNDAFRYCEQLKSSPHGWQLCLNKFMQLSSFGNQNETNLLSREQNDQVRFWCLSTIHEIIKKYYNHLDQSTLSLSQFFTPELKNHLRSSLMIWLRDVATVHFQPNFIKNKFCVLLVAIFQVDYPDEWRSFFTDILSILNYVNTDNSRIEIMDYLMRLLLTIDADIVVFDENRTAQQISQNTKIKDAMREFEMPKLFDLIFEIIRRFGTALKTNASEKSIVQQSLKVVSEFIGWCDIQLVVCSSADHRFLKLLYSLLYKLEFGEQTCECLYELIKKRMDSDAKLSLVEEIQILNVISQINFKPTEFNNDFIEKLSAVIFIIGANLIDCIKELNGEKRLKSQELLEQTIEISYRIMQVSDFEVRESVVELLINFTSLLKQSSHSSDLYPSSLLSSHLPRMFDCILHAILFPEWYDFDAAPEDDQSIDFNIYRENILRLFGNVVKIDNESVLQLLATRLDSTLQNWYRMSYSEIEAILRLFYVIGESLKGGINQRVTVEPFRSLMTAILTSKISSHKHPQISLIYFAIVVRYSRYFDSHPQHLSSVLLSFIDDRGLRHSNRTVRGRVCYQLFRLVQALPDTVRNQIAPYLDQILSAIQSVIHPIVTESDFSFITLEDFNYLCEVLGILIGSSVSGNERCRHYFEVVCRFFQQQIDLPIQNRQNWFKSPDSIETYKMGIRFAIIIDAIGNLTKHIGRDSPQTKDLLSSAFESVLSVFQLIPNHDDVRNKTIFFIHRMIECLQIDTLSFLNTTIPILIQQSNSTNILPVLQLLHQFVAKFKNEQLMIQFFDAFLIPIFAKFSECLHSYDHIEAAASNELQTNGVIKSSLNSKSDAVSVAYSSDIQERLLLQRTFYHLIRLLVTSDLSSVFMTPQNSPHLQNILDSISSACVNPIDPLLQKTVYQIVRSLFKYWLNINIIHSDSRINQFLTSQIPLRIWHYVFSPEFDLTDAAFASCFREQIELQRDVLRTFYPNGSIEQLKSMLINQFSIDSEIGNQLIILIQSAPSNNPIRHFIQEIRIKKGLSTPESASKVQLNTIPKQERKKLQNRTSSMDSNLSLQNSTTNVT